MKRSRKVLLIGTAAFALIAGYLAAFTLISSSHPMSKAAIAQSSVVAKAVGDPSVMVLIGARQKLVPGGKSCSRNSYLVFGNAGWAVVISNLSMQGNESDWRVDGLALGWFGDDRSDC